MVEKVSAIMTSVLSAAYGITHWWFSRKQFYINKYSEPSDRDAVRSHMRILSVISIKTYERYGYNYVREIVLRRADYNEYKISEKDFKKDYTIVNKPRAVIYKDRDDNKKMMRINKVHKFSDGTLMRIWDKLDFIVKDFRLFKFNKGMENRKWTEDDKRRSEDFIEVIERRLKIRRIFQKHPSETKVFHNEDGNPARANIKQALGSFKDGDGDGDTHYERSHKGVKASANSDIVYFFTSAQDGNTLQDDERLDLADDLMKAQVHNQRQVNDESKDH
ncbi:hypothetical protein Tco_0643397 [Tanacetum coccineum]